MIELTSLNLQTGFRAILQKYLTKKQGSLQSRTIKTYTFLFSKAEYEWLISHPIRKAVLMQVNRNLYTAYVIHKICPTICSVNANILFSIFSEHSAEKRIPGFAKNWVKKRVTGVAKLKEQIIELTQDKGFAAHCVLVYNQKKSVHQFVVEVNMKRELYIYQSYVNRYTLENCLENIQPKSPQKVTDQLEFLCGKVTREKEPVYAELFGGSLLTGHEGGDLSFEFISLQYEQGDVPKVE